VRIFERYGGICKNDQTSGVSEIFPNTINYFVIVLF
jgi:hypothetical protein